MLLFNKSIRFQRLFFSKFGFIFFSIQILSLLITTQNVHSFDITLGWNFSKELMGEITGYRVFYRKKGEYYNENNKAEVKDLTKTTCTITDLDNNYIYCFVVKAFDVFSGSESLYSNEVCYYPNSATQTNSPPIADNKSVTTVEDTPIDITLSAADTNLDFLTYTVVIQPSHGTLSGTAPNITYTPDTNFFGSDSFSFKVNDDITDSNIANINITICPVIEDHIVECTIYEDAEDGNINGWTIIDEDPTDAWIGNVFDTDRQSRVISVSKNYFYLFRDVEMRKWENSSQFLAMWSMQCSGYFEVYFDVNTTAGDKSLYYTPVDSDKLEDSLYIHHGLGSNVIDNKWHSFERNLQDDLEEAQPGVSILEVNGFMVYGSGRMDDIVLCNTLNTDPNDIPENSPPIANDKSIITFEDTPLNITLTATDKELDTLTYILVTQPSYGTLSGTAPNLTYSPNANYTGFDSFTFKVNDGQRESNIATVSITITSLNDAPLASAQVFTTQEDVAINKTLSASDVDGDRLTYTFVTNGSKGNATITDSSTGAFTYKPYKDMNVTDTFRFKVNDGTTDSLTAMVTVNIIPVNDAPLANSQSLVAYENTALDILLTGSDVDGDTLTYVIVTQPSNGTLSGIAPNIIYIPNTNYFGSDSFSFKVNDGVVDSNTANISITICSVIEDPIIECTVYEDAEDGNINGWIIFDEDSLDAWIDNVFDTDRQSRVIELESVSKNYCYFLRDVEMKKWKNSSQFLARWSMQYSDYFVVYFDVHTTAGYKCVYYTPVDFNALGGGLYVHHGLGSNVTDGQWHSFERNLQTDLEEAQPGVMILYVNGFKVYGSGRVDNIELCDTHQN